MADFNFYLNRQGPQGKKGDPGDAGFSPIVSIYENTPTSFKLQITQVDGTFVTENLKSFQINDLGGPIMMYNSTTGEISTGFLPMASTSTIGGLYLATTQDALDGNREDCIITPGTLQDKIDNAVGNGTINIVQGGVFKGSFTVNQSGETTINLDAGSEGITVDSIDGGVVVAPTPEPTESTESTEASEPTEPTEPSENNESNEE